jgi:hypothetical protein
MFAKAFRTLFTPNGNRGASRALRAVLALEPSKARELLATFTWTGAAGLGDLNWSTMNNWKIGMDIANRLPGPNDAVEFDIPRTSRSRTPPRSPANSPPR